jgi:hypothetical protein
MNLLWEEVLSNTKKKSWKSPGVLNLTPKAPIRNYGNPNSMILQAKSVVMPSQLLEETLPFTGAFELKGTLWVLIKLPVPSKPRTRPLVADCPKLMAIRLVMAGLPSDHMLGGIEHSMGLHMGRGSSGIRAFPTVLSTWPFKNISHIQV